MMKNTGMLFIDNRVVREILSMDAAISAVEEAFREKGQGKVVMPPKLYVFLDEFKGDFRVMPAYLRESNIAGVKVVSVYPNNSKLYNLPTVIAVVELLDPKTGKPLCIMDGTWLTAMRTGAAGGIAAKYLARVDSKIIGMVGAGTQARTQLEALNVVLKNIELVQVYDIIRSKSEEYARDMEKRLGIEIRVTDSIEKAVKNVDIVVTTTPSTRPIVKSEWIGEGVHINAIGADAPGKQELDPMILKRAKIVVDDLEQARHSGEVNVPLSKGILSREDIYAELGEIIARLKPGRTSYEEITVFDSTGLAIQDIATAWLVYKEAKKRGLGLELKI